MSRHKNKAFHGIKRDSRPKSQKSTGIEFENKIRDDVMGFVNKENSWRKKTEDPKFIRMVPYSEIKDRSEGTDIMLYDKSGFFGNKGELRLDLTMNFNNKDNMMFRAAQSTVIEGRNRNYIFHYGIRTGNLDHNFEKPVVVVGTNLKSDAYKAFEKDAKAQMNLSKNMYEMLNMANDTLSSFLYQTDDKYRAKIDRTFEKDERPDKSLLIANRQFMKEVKIYTSDRWKLQPDTELNSRALALYARLNPNEKVEELQQKYFNESLAEMATEDKGGCIKFLNL